MYHIYVAYSHIWVYFRQCDRLFFTLFNLTAFDSYRIYGPGARFTKNLKTNLG